MARVKVWFDRTQIGQQHTESSRREPLKPVASGLPIRAER